MPGYMNVPAAIDEAKKLLDRKAKLLTSIDTVRSDLRNAVERKEADADQTKWIEEQFPVRERTRLTDDEKKILADAKKAIEEKRKKDEAGSASSMSTPTAA